MPEHAHGAGADAVDNTMRADPHSNQSGREACRPWQTGQSTCIGTSTRRPALSASGGVISNQICLDLTSVSAAHPAFFSNRTVSRVFPTSKSYRAGTRSRPPNGPSALRVGAVASRGYRLVDAAQQAGAVVSKQPLNHPCLFMFPT